MNFYQRIKGCKQAFNRGLHRWINYKTVGLTLLASTLAIFGDASLLAMGHVLHLVFGVVEVIVGHFLEVTFDLTKRQAQFVLAYSTLTLGIYFFIRLMRRAYLATVQTWHAVKRPGLQVANSAITCWSKVKWRRFAITFGAIGASIYLFS